MTAIAAPMPRNLNKIFRTILAILVSLALGFGATYFLLRRMAPMDVTLKPCATCATCTCKPLLGGPRCGCPR